MRPFRRARAILAVWVVLVVVTRDGRGADRVVVTARALPSAEEIMRRGVANDELRRQHRLRWECDQVITTQHLDATGAVTKTKTAHVVHQEGTEFAYFREGDSPTEHRASQDGDTVKAERSMAIMNLARLAPSYEYAPVDLVRAQGRDCYLIAFTPLRPRRAGTAEQKAIGLLRGRFWIDQKTYEILQGEGSIASPASIGLLASIRSMSFVFHNRKTPRGEVEPADLTVDYTVTAPFSFFRQRQAIQLENWRPASD